MAAEKIQSVCWLILVFVPLETQKLPSPVPRCPAIEQIAARRSAAVKICRFHNIQQTRANVWAFEHLHQPYSRMLDRLCLRVPLDRSRLDHVEASIKGFLANAMLVGLQQGTSILLLCTSGSFDAQSRHLFHSVAVDWVDHDSGSIWFLELVTMSKCQQSTASKRVRMTSLPLAALSHDIPFAKYPHEMRSSVPLVIQLDWSELSSPSVNLTVLFSFSRCPRSGPMSSIRVRYWCNHWRERWLFREQGGCAATAHFLETTIYR